ncbi:hypothetical protein [Umezawaea sp.]|uniref:hypothetical protein n=1 Tax=Umezawaea sp. TaxID=1955258 RepID=UPI002ED3AE19
MTGQVEVELGTGFSDDAVVVLLDGAEVWRSDGVTTNYSVGLAGVVRLPDDVAGTLEVRVRNEARSTRIEPGEHRLRVDLDPSGAPRLRDAPEGPVF